MTLRFSRELADDEGRVFVAYAPPRPLLVLGRRDPRTGELCVGQVLTPRPNAPDSPWPDPDDPNLPRMEHVTGPEAESLLDAVEHWMAEGAPGGRWIMT
jgi:hypothetical protein